VHSIILTMASGRRLTSVNSTFPKIIIIIMLYWLIDWLVLNANFSNISAILWHEQTLKNNNIDTCCL
jgi:hypothetical protein